MARVDYACLDVAIDGSQATLFHGQPFTGVAVEVHPNGAVLSETEFADGFPFGMERSWYPTGVLSEELRTERGAYEGPLRRWSEDGVLVEEREYERGIVVRSRRYRSDGTLEVETELGPDESDYAILLQRRAFHGQADK
jgi:antitoxin component YwqK of YwqJK toxin-antitoxin module